MTYTTESDIEAMADALKTSYDTCTDFETAVRAVMAASPVHAELERVKAENERLREAIQDALESGDYDDALGASKHGGCQHFVVPQWVGYLTKAIQQKGNN